jgi:TamB, inner membrane protein subunit of TAM complex
MPEEIKPNERSRFWRIIYKLGRFGQTTTGIIIIIILGLYTLIQSPPFQNWAISKTTKYLSEELQTTVKIDRISLDLLDKVDLEGFYVADLKGDTLLYAEHFKLDYAFTWRSLYLKGFAIEGLNIENAQCNLKRKKGEKNNNLQFIIDYFTGEKKEQSTKKGTPFDLRVSYISLKKINFLQDDEVEGNKTTVALGEGSLSFNKFDRLNNQFIIKELRLVEPVIAIAESEKYPLPEDEKIEQPKGQATTVKDTAQEKKLAFSLQLFNLSNGSLRYDNFRKSPTRQQADIIDANHLNINKLSVVFSDLDLKKDNLVAKLKQVSFDEQSGFSLLSFNVDKIKLSPKGFELNKFEILTPFSHIGDTLQLKYTSFEAFKQFERKVLMNIALNDSRVALKDLAFFDYSLAKNKFFQKNIEENITLNTNISGNLSNIKFNQLSLKTKGLRLEGTGKIRDIFDSDNALIDAKITTLATDINTIESLVPNLQLPDNIKTINKLSYEGTFIGFTNNITTTGNLTTDIGSVALDMSLNNEEGNEKANYRGMVKLRDFDLGKIAGRDDLGKISFSAEVKNGTGLTKETAKADLIANIESLPFRGYNYKNVKLDGKLDKSFFDGDFSTKDENIAFSFKGKVNFSDSIPSLNLKANIENINLKGLNLAKQDIKMKGKVDMALKGRSLDDLAGTVRFKNIDFNVNRTYYYVDSLVLHSEVAANQYRRLDIDSEVLVGAIDGNFDYKTLPNALVNYTIRNHPNVAYRMGLQPKENIIFPKDNFLRLNLNVLNSKNFLLSVDKNLDTLRNVTLRSYFEAANDSLFFDIAAPKNIKYNGTVFQDVVISAGLRNGFGEGFLGVLKTISKKTELGAILVPINFAGDALDLTIKSDKITKDLKNLTLKTDFFIEKDFFQLGIKPSSFMLGNEQWAIDTAKNIRFDRQNIDIPYVLFKNKNRQIVATDINKRGIALTAKGFNFEDISNVINDDKLRLKGDMVIAAKVEDVFAMKNIHATVSADTMIWNKRDFGVFRLDTDLKDLNSPAKVYLSLTNGSEQLAVEGFYVLPMKGRAYVYQDTIYEQNEMYGKLMSSNFPMIWIKYLVGSGLSNLKGVADANIKIGGTPDCPMLNGDVRVRDVGFKIDYLNTSFFIKDGVAKVTDNIIEAKKQKIYDELGNEAIINGNVTHQYFNYLRLNLVIDSGEKDVLVMNTTKEQNNLYYGRGIGKMRVRFSGSFNRTYINVEKAITGKGTVLSIPVSNAQTANAVSFVKFADKKLTIKKDSLGAKPNLNGLNFEMALTMTEDAVAQIIFDERAGDVIKGRGNGLIKLDVPISGPFKMLGDYRFSEGDYLFTIRQKFVTVDKPFAIRRGGTLSWINGDPFGAQIDLTADYKGLRAPSYNLIADLIPQAGGTEERNARQTTDIDLTMQMTGQLLKPDIGFDIRFPTLVGNLKNYADSKLNLLKQDPAELNRQVFGLIVLGDFLPTTNSTTANEFIGNTVNNTLSGIISNQLSNYINGWLSDIVKDNKYINSIDFDINTRGGISTDRASVVVNELQLKPRFNLFDNRLSIDAGGVVGGDYAQTDNDGLYIAGDFAVEYKINKEGNIRVRAYNRTVQEIDGPRNRSGGGIGWRKDFDKWGDLKKKRRK